LCFGRLFAFVVLGLIYSVLAMRLAGRKSLTQESNGVCHAEKLLWFSTEVLC